MLRNGAAIEDAVWENIMLRAKNYQALVDLSNATKNYDLIEAKFVVEANDQFP